MVERKRGRSVGKSISDCTRLHGGDTDDVYATQKLVRSRLLEYANGGDVDDRTVMAISSFHGSDYEAVLGLLGGPDCPDMGVVSSLPGRSYVGHTHVLHAEVVNACRHEMATRLDDVILRRTELADGCHPGVAVLKEVAEIMTREFAWSNERQRQEIEIADRSLRHRRYRELNPGRSN